MNDKKPRKITHISAVEQVCESLKQSILADEWQIGEKLPSESSLAELYGVNRLTVRMALQKLNTLGIVETKVGEGTYIKKFSLGDLFYDISDFFSSKKPIDEIYSLRMLIEVECCRLAMIHATSHDLENLKKQLDRYLAARERFQQTATEDCLQILVEEDLLFHYHLFRISHNTVYADLFLLIKNIIRQYLLEIIPRKNNLWLEKKYSEDPDNHVTIYKALLDKDLDACKQAYNEALSINLVMEDSE
ncbi:FadR/GntR family transcriptional regulator [Lacrimispora amygdalina]|uniref:FadR/GntR family transcriptional regulator n=1 Tax=Lacrimispora amygdalina TaxID=253257 RepID=UPI000BE21FFB|nr:GntR family transcriptional regulator [Lacrimispora amygdalina]